MCDTLRQRPTNDLRAQEVLSWSNIWYCERIVTTVVLWIYTGQNVMEIGRRTLHTFSTSVSQYSGLFEGRPFSETLNHPALAPSAVVASVTCAMYTCFVLQSYQRYKLFTIHIGTNKNWTPVVPTDCFVRT